MTGKPQRRGDPPDPATSPAPFGQFEDARSGGDPAMANATPGAVLALADQLDQAGSTASAHRLYARVASTIAERWPPDRVAKLLAATRDAGSTEATAVLMDAVVHTSGSYSASAAHLAGILTCIHSSSFVASILQGRSVLQAAIQLRVKASAFSALTVLPGIDSSCSGRRITMTIMEQRKRRELRITHRLDDAGGLHLARRAGRT